MNVDVAVAVGDGVSVDVGVVLGIGLSVGVNGGGNHWVGVGSHVAVGSTVPRVGVAEGGAVNVAVGTGVGILASGFNCSIEIPMQ